MDAWQIWLAGPGSGHFHGNLYINQHGVEIKCYTNILLLCVNDLLDYLVTTESSSNQEPNWFWSIIRATITAIYLMYILILDWKELTKHSILFIEYHTYLIYSRSCILDFCWCIWVCHAAIIFRSYTYKATNRSHTHALRKLTSVLEDETWERQAAVKKLVPEDNSYVAMCLWAKGKFNPPHIRAFLMPSSCYMQRRWMNWLELLLSNLQFNIMHQYHATVKSSVNPG